MDTRTKRLQQLINERFNGRQVDLHLKTGISTSQIGQWLGGHRVMGEKSASRIEKLCGLSPGWLSKNDEVVQINGIKEVLFGLSSVFSSADDILKSQLEPLILALIRTPERLEEISLRFESTLEMGRKHVALDLPYERNRVSKKRVA